MKDFSRVLITGASGNLGSSLVKSPFLSKYSLITPSRNELDITQFSQVKKFISSEKIDLVIHTAALARMGECEKNPASAIESNIIGTSNLVRAILELEQLGISLPRFIHISTDGVYQGTDGNYSEISPTIPFNFYGWTKLGAEASLRSLKDIVIIRTRFFNPENIRFNSSPTDVYTSKVSINYLVQAIYYLAKSDFKGVINIGEDRHSEFEINSRFKSGIVPCRVEFLENEVGHNLAHDASMNTELWQSLMKKNGWKIHE